MKNILVPIDFTKVSQNALRYAHEAYPNDRLIICHVYDGLFSTQRKVIKAGMTKDMIVKEEVELFCQQTIENRRPVETMEVHVRNGNPIRGIVKLAQELRVVEIIMGNRDKYNLMDKLIGTVALGVIKETYIPVKLIPAHSCYTPYKNVLVSIDEEADDDQIEMVDDWNVDYGAYIRFEHVDEHFKLSDDKKQELIEDLIDEMQSTSGYELNLVRGAKPSDTIVQKAQDKKVDLIISFPRKGNILKTLFAGSMSKKLMIKADIPLLFM